MKSAELIPAVGSASLRIEGRQTLLMPWVKHPLSGSWSTSPLQKSRVLVRKYLNPALRGPVILHVGSTKAFQTSQILP